MTKLTTALLALALFGGCAARNAESTALASLQGRWEGVTLEQDAEGAYYVPDEPEEIAITIEGDSLYFYKDESFWWYTTITLPTDREPPHLVATIERPEANAGDVVIAFFQVDDDVLTLAGVRGPESYEPDWPTSFEGAESRMAGRYRVRRVEP